MRRNNKGFTLVELLAVIVILAVIMIIATQQVNGLIKKSRMSSFNDSVGVAVKTAKIFIADENLTQDRLRRGIDYSSNEYEIYLSNLSNGNYVIVGVAKPSGKFGKVESSVEGFARNNNYCYVTTGSTKAIAVELAKLDGEQNPNGSLSALENFELKDEDGNKILTIKCDSGSSNQTDDSGDETE